MSYRPLDALVGGVPEGESVGADPAPSCDPELHLHLPPVERRLQLGPDHALLASERRRDADALLARDRV